MAATPNNHTTPTPDTPPRAPKPVTVSSSGAPVSVAQKTLVYGLLTIGGLILLFPLYWMIVVSFASPGEAAKAAVSAEGFPLIPSFENWRNYLSALLEMGARRGDSFRDAFANSVVVTTLCVIGQVFSCSLCGYAFARLRFRGREPMFILMLSTMMLPPQVTMIPMFLLFRWLGWIDSILPLVVPMYFGNPFFIFMFRQFFAQVPEALVEAARIDGCGHLRIWWKIMLPMCKPVIAITAVFTFMFVWNDFLGPLIYLHTEENYTLAVALNSFRNQYGGVNEVHLLMAASIITMVPCVILFFVAQKQFVGGLSLGAVKG